MEVSASAPSGLLAALLVEFAGNVVLHAEVIRPAVDRGEVVIQETYPYKHVLKEYLVTAEASRRSDAPSYSAAEVDALFAMVERFFANELRPDLGLLMDGPVELAYRWRMRQSGRTGILEDFRIAGTPGHEGFIRLQSESAHHYRRFARDWGWQLHTVQDDPVEENLARGLGLVRSEIRRLRPGWNLS
jgi:hypothetical protein